MEFSCRRTILSFLSVAVLHFSKKTVSIIPVITSDRYDEFHFGTVGRQYPDNMDWSVLHVCTTSLGKLFLAIRASLGVVDWVCCVHFHSSKIQREVRVLNCHILTLWNCFRLPSWIQQMLAAVGILLIFVSIYTLNSRHTYPFPNCYTLLPTVGTFLVLVFGDSRTVVGQMLSLDALRRIGLISYSLYLWHQPLFTFIPLIHLQPLTNFSVLVVIIFLVALSIITYHVIERPFRNTNHLRAKQVFQLTVLATMFSVILSVLIVHKTNKYMGSSTQNVDAQLHSKIEAMYGRSICYGIWDQREECKSFSNSTLKKLLVVGDSYGDDTMHMIQQGGHLREYEMRGFYIPNKCQIYLGDRSRYDFIAVGFHQQCRRSPDILDGGLLISRADLIIFASYWFQWSLENLSSTIQRLNLTTNQRYLIVSGKHLHPCNERSGVTQLQRYRHESKLMFPPSVVQGNRILRKTFSASKFIDLEKLLCNGPNETCHVFTPNGELIFRDCFHLSRCGARYLGNIVFGQNHFNLNF